MLKYPKNIIIKKINDKYKLKYIFLSLNNNNTKKNYSILITSKLEVFIKHKIKKD